MNASDVLAILDESDKHLQFNDKNHRYKVGKNYIPSVTTILGVMNKPGLMWWAAREQRKADAAKLVEFGYDGNTLAAYFAQTDGDAHTRVSREAAGLGTGIHTMAENYCRGLLGLEQKSFDPSDDQMFLFAGFERWAKDVKMEPVAMERRVVHTVHGYAGTLDLLAFVEGRLTVLDWKSSRSIYGEMLLQVAAYGGACRSMGIAVEEGRVVRFPKDEESSDLEVVAADVDSLMEVFLHAKGIYDWNKGRS